MKYLIFLLALLPIAAQDRYIASATTTALTLQQPATDAKDVSFPPSGSTGASVYCAAAQTATFSWNGTGATATAGSAKMIPPTVKPSNATIWTASNVGSGTTGPVYNIQAGQTMSFDLGWFHMGAAGIQNNLTITTNGSCTITITWMER